MAQFSLVAPIMGQNALRVKGNVPNWPPRAKICYFWPIWAILGRNGLETDWKRLLFGYFGIGVYFHAQEVALRAPKLGIRGMMDLPDHIQPMASAGGDIGDPMGPFLGHILLLLGCQPRPLALHAPSELGPGRLFPHGR